MIGKVLLLIAGFSLDPASGFFYQFASQEACERAKSLHTGAVRKQYPQSEWVPACAKVAASGKAFVLLHPEHSGTYLGEAPGIFIQVEDMELCAEFKAEALATTRNSFPRTSWWAQCETLSVQFHGPS